MARDVGRRADELAHRSGAAGDVVTAVDLEWMLVEGMAADDAGRTAALQR
ncbi:Hypothetical protein A7982_06615 [Minicystis rosea]|nr:Hypothetical protein A7982_06615 [Minicystis rosea]